MSLLSQADYEQLIYALPQSHPEIAVSSLHLYNTSRGTAIVRGSIRFENGIELRVSEILDFVAGRISDYSYTVIRDGMRIRWYDSQPHPEIPELGTTFPHHYHEQPDIKHNRHPAPNLPAPIAEIARLE